MLMKQLDPKAVWLFFIKFLSGLLPIMIFFGAGFSSYFQDASPLLIVFVIVILPWTFIAYIFSKLTYHYYKYELLPEGFRKEHGIIWKKYVTIPYDRIQNVDIYRGLVARLLGLSDLQIQTAGGISAGSYGAMSEGRLPGLSKEVAETLRDELIRKRPNHSAQGL